MLDHVGAEFRALDLGGTVHEAGKIVGDFFRTDRAVEAFHDVVRGFIPAEVAEHHFAAEDDAAGVHLILVGVLRRGAVRGFEDGVAGEVVDVAAGGDADAADLRGSASLR